MTRQKSLQRFLRTYSLVFIGLNLGSLAFCAALLWIWGEASGEAIRLTGMIATLKEMRGTAYRQVKEAFDSRFLGDRVATAEYNEFAATIERQMGVLKQSSVYPSEKTAALAVEQAYAEIAARTAALLAEWPDQPPGIREANLDDQLERGDFPAFESALAEFERELAARRTERQDQARRLLALLPILLAIPLLSSIGTFFWSRRYLSLRVLTPLQRLERAMHELPHGGELPTQCPEAAAEIEHLAETLASMATEIRHSRQALVRAERDSALAALVPVLAHNIRNPLASIRAAAQVCDTPAVDVETRETLQAIVRTTDRIESWTRSMLSYLGPMQPHLQRCDLRALCDTALDLLQPLIASRKVTIQRSGWEQEHPAPADPVLMEQALHGLIANALEASPTQGEIGLSLGAFGNPSVTIEDDGPGIPFQPVAQRLAPGPTTKPYGTGLGIPFALRVCELHGAEISFESRSPNGTRVILRFSGENETNDPACR